MKMNKEQQWLAYVTKLRNEHNVELDLIRKESATYKSRKDTLEEWLTEYRNDLKKTNVFHKNEAIINEINELLFEP
jgi:hypothetical protein